MNPKGEGEGHKGKTRSWRIESSSRPCRSVSLLHLLRGARNHNHGLVSARQVSYHCITSTALDFLLVRQGLTNTAQTGMELVGDPLASAL